MNAPCILRSAATAGLAWTLLRIMLVSAETGSSASPASMTWMIAGVILVGAEDCVSIDQEDMNASVLKVTLGLTAKDWTFTLAGVRHVSTAESVWIMVITTLRADARVVTKGHTVKQRSMNA